VSSKEIRMRTEVSFATDKKVSLLIYVIHLRITFDNQMGLQLSQRPIKKIFRHLMRWNTNIKSHVTM